MSNVLEMIGIVGILVSAIPAGLGFLFVLMAVLTRPNHTGAFHNPISILIFMLKSPEEIAYGGKLLLRWGVILVISMALVKNFGNTFYI